MSRADATLAAIVAKIAATGTRWLVWPADVAPRGCYGRPVTVGTVERHLRRAGYATRARDGWWELTPAGLAAVDAVHAVAPGADTASARSPGGIVPRCGQAGAEDETGEGRAA